MFIFNNLLLLLHKIGKKAAELLFEVLIFAQFLILTCQFVFVEPIKDVDKVFVILKFEGKWIEFNSKHFFYVFNGQLSWNTEARFSELWGVRRDLYQIFYEGVSFLIICDLIFTIDEHLWKLVLEIVLASSNLFQQVM